MLPFDDDIMYAFNLKIHGGNRTVYEMQTIVRVDNLLKNTHPFDHYRTVKNFVQMGNNA